MITPGRNALGRPGAIPRLLGLALLCRWGAHEAGAIAPNALRYLEVK